MDQIEAGNPYEKEPGQKKQKTFGQGFFTGMGVTVSAVMLIGVLAAALQGVRSDGILPQQTENKLKYINAMLDRYYYKDITDEEKQEAMYRGLVSSAGDPFTEYYTAEEYAEYKIDTTGIFYGIGLTLRKDQETQEVVVVRPIEGSPADQAGIVADDILISADGKPATEYTLDEFVGFVRGEKGVDVEIVYKHNGEEHTAMITRDEVVVPSVDYKLLNGNIGYMILYDFASKTEEEYKAAMEDLSSQGMEAVIFDLRFNGGGLVDSTTKILDDILPEGTTVYMLNKSGKRIDYTSDAEKTLDIPIAILTSEATASSAEIFSGAIRDFEYGTLIGTRTYGKGIVQTTFPLEDGSCMKITTETYYTPKGEEIQGVGIEPDIEIEYDFLGEEGQEYDESLDNQIQKAIEVLNEKLEKANTDN